jgi:hypothetical protein
MTELREPERCDGCGHDSTALNVIRDDANDVEIARYCPGCQTLREVHGIARLEHEQYRLRDAVGGDDEPDDDDDGDGDADTITMEDYLSPYFSPEDRL